LSGDRLSVANTPVLKETDRLTWRSPGKAIPARPDGLFVEGIVSSSFIKRVPWRVLRRPFRLSRRHSRAELIRRKHEPPAGPDLAGLGRAALN